MKLPPFYVFYTIILFSAVSTAKPFGVQEGLHAQLITKEPVKTWLMGNETWVVEASPENDGLYIWAMPNSTETNITAYTDNYTYRFDLVLSDTEHTPVIKITGEPRGAHNIKPTAPTKKFSPLDDLLDAAGRDNSNRGTPTTPHNFSPRSESSPRAERIPPSSITSKITPIIKEEARELSQKKIAIAPTATGITKIEPTSEQATVGDGDTLGSITQRLYYGEKTSDQHLSAVFNHNKNAFLNSNPHKVKHGAVIHKPTQDEVTAAQPLNLVQYSDPTQAVTKAQADETTEEAELRARLVELRKRKVESLNEREALLERLNSLEAQLAETKKLFKG